MNRQNITKGAIIDEYLAGETTTYRKPPNTTSVFRPFTSGCRYFRAKSELKK
ncbi:MAG: hypothetical protein V1781_01730 [Bacteroidota bacterium]